MRIRPLVLLFLLACLAPGATHADDDAPPTIRIADAMHHVGDVVRICGNIADAAYFESIRGKPTFLNFDRPYPNSPFTVVVWGESLSKFEKPPHLAYNGRDVCVTGRVETHKGKPQIIVHNPAQVEVMAQAFEPERFSYEERVFLKGTLSALGYAVDVGSGDWDDATEAALREFQQSMGLEVDGEGSAATLRKLAEASVGLNELDKTRIVQLFLLNLAQREGP